MSIGVVAAVSLEQINEIVKTKRSLPITVSSAANGKARSACALFHPGWGAVIVEYENAAIRALHKARAGKPYDTLDTVTFLRAVESFALGIIAQMHLTLDEYNVLISSVCSVAAPELMLDKQNWETQALPNRNDTEVVTRFKEHVEKVNRNKRPYRHKEEEPDIDMDSIMSMLAGKKDEPKPVLGDDKQKKALADVLAKFGKNPASSRVSDNVPESEPMDSVAEDDTRDAGQIALSEGVRLQQESGENGKGVQFNLESSQTKQFIAGTFESRIEAIAFAQKNKWKLKP